MCAMGRHKRPSECKECGSVATDRNIISYRGLCARCAYTRTAQNTASIATRQGPEYERWRAALQRYADTLE